MASSSITSSAVETFACGAGAAPPMSYGVFHGSGAAPRPAALAQAVASAVHSLSPTLAAATTPSLSKAKAMDTDEEEEETHGVQANSRDIRDDVNAMGKVDALDIEHLPWDQLVALQQRINKLLQPSAKAFSTLTWDTQFAGEPALAPSTPPSPGTQPPSLPQMTLPHIPTPLRNSQHQSTPTKDSSMLQAKRPTLSHTWQIQATTPHKYPHTHAPPRNSQNASNKPQDNHMLQAKRRTPSHTC